MSKFLLIILAFCAVAVFGTETPAYVGADKCKACHNSIAKGGQYTQWKSTKHATAFETLKNEASAKIAKAKGIKDASADAKCTKCHITDKAFMQEGVSCEVCHGPGSIYRGIKYMKNKEEAMKVGLIEPSEKGCLKCHNSESPTFKKFDFKTEYAKIAHPNPLKKK